jgi:hypothetical protein
MSASLAGYEKTRVPDAGEKGAGYEKKYRNSRIGSLAVICTGLGAAGLRRKAAEAKWFQQHHATGTEPKCSTAETDP